MELSSSGVLIVLLLLPVCFCSEFVAVDAIDAITASQPLKYPETITSSDSAFKLGFFSPVNSTNRYVGIWYNDKSEAVIWVANRNRPLKDASGVVTISEDGNLVVLNGQKEVLWSSNVLNPVTNASAQVLGSGNLVLNNISGSIWESFGQPTDTLMRRMRLSTDTKTDKKDMKVVVIVSAVVGVVAIAICTFFLWWWMAKRKAMKEKSKMPQLLDLPVFNFEKLAIATNNFNLTNKLGQGGFGPVYKGVLQDRQEIAVKRLSKASGQEDQDYLDTLLSSPTLDHPYYWSTKKQLAVMDPRSRSIALALVLVLSCFYSNLGSALDTITSSQLIRDNETIISSGSAFKLGFFSPVNSSNRYVGILFNDRSETVIWVANRNKPLKDASGVLKISEDGNLVVLNGQNEVLWSSNVSKPLTNATAQLLDSGNLVLVDSTNGKSIWESFQDPTDKILSGMKLSTNKRTGQKVQLTSWKNPSDPSPGSYSHGIESSNIPEAFTWNDSQVYWRTGPWNGQNFIGVNGIVRYTYSNDGFQLLADTQADAVSFTYSFLNLSMFFTLSSQGNIEGRYWNEGKKNWDVNFQSLQTECDVYGLCGAFGNCNPKKNPICSCLRGYEPKNIEEWNSGNWTSGCVRKRLLQCERMNQTGDKVENDGYLKLETMKLPVFAARSFVTIEKCRELCLNNCSCIAYAYEAGIGCMTWTGSLIDLQKFSIGGADLYIRLAHSELEKKDNKVVVIVPVVAGTITCAICIFFVCKGMTKRKGKVLYLDKDDACPGENLNEVELQDIPLFNFEKLATATNNFHSTNKLGQGGFGPVYKGELEDGKEIAVKRLSKASEQGLEEFKNEVLVISKLQHRNLVRLLGYCIDREEKMLIYEYMPNKSLDALLFDPLKQELLDWRKRFNIIEGISRGLLYLHRDSRLRIIHRDLKPSNILLDKELNPKISDFGMARIFGGNEDQANTIRVVGTYGYMSPEYVMEGRFSEKSDVFSFGVLLLEIVSGRRNTGVYHDAESLSLIGYALKLWNENNIVALIDPVISDPCFQSEISRCIHVGLLCVQEFVKDRPTMSTVISMLNSEIVDLPTPKQLAFTERRNFEEESSQQSQKRCSINYVTVTIVTEGR